MQIDRLLDTVIKLNASDLHLTVGRKPTLRLHGGLKNLDTKVLDSDDMVTLMKAITSERSQQELQEVGSARLRLRLRRRRPGSACRSSASAATSRSSAASSPTSC
jgi:Tfp pilus assembly pilus retraction ATPase PilT